MGLSRTVDSKTPRTAFLKAVWCSASGLYLASAGQDRKLLIWDLHKKAAIAEQQTDAPLVSIDWCPDGNKLLCMTAQGKVLLWHTPVPKGYPGPCAEADALETSQALGSRGEASESLNGDGKPSSLATQMRDVWEALGADRSFKDWIADSKAEAEEERDRERPEGTGFDDIIHGDAEDHEEEPSTQQGASQRHISSASLLRPVAAPKLQQSFQPSQSDSGAISSHGCCRTALKCGAWCSRF